ncbi:hypothetical protein KR018_000655 [Drosophila ironensis]|nr:hypothetical protein KR018_000655 [Drosophila ironensis]
MPPTETIENPNEALVIPKWLKKAKFESLLAKDEPAFDRIIKYTPVAAVPPGGNFASVMIRVYLNLELKGENILGFHKLYITYTFCQSDGSQTKKSYIVKTTLDAEKGGKQVNEFRYFHKEQQMYSTYLPAFEKLYREAGHPMQLMPKCLEIGEIEGNLYFIFEDLAPQGYVSADRYKGIDMEHMRLSLRKLAQLHAASAVYKDRVGSFSVDFQHGFAKKDNIPHSLRGFDAKSPEYIAAMKTWGLEEAYLKNFPTIEQYSKVCLESLNVDPQDFNVLTHGDFSSNNILYKYDESGALQNAFILDFQLCKWGSPAQDLLFLITISPSKELRVKEFDNFVRIYYEYLIEYLAILQYAKPLPRLRDLQAALSKKNNTLYAFFPVMNHLPSLLIPSTRESNLHTVMSKDEVGKRLRTRMYTNPDYLEVIRELYPLYCNRGLFNFEDFE